MSESTYIVDEDAGRMHVCANMNGARDISITIQISTRHGTAGTNKMCTLFMTKPLTFTEAGVLSDFVSFLYKLTFEPHDTQKCVTVTIIDDAIVENTENFYVDLTQTPDLDSRVIIKHGTSTIEIIDDDDGGKSPLPSFPLLCCC